MDFHRETLSSSFRLESYLSYLGKKLTLDEKNWMRRNCSELHRPNRLSVDDVWKPLETLSFEGEDLPELCFVLGNLLHSYDSEIGSLGYQVVYASSLYLYAMRIRNIGPQLESAAVRQALGVLFARGDDVATRFYLSFLVWLVHHPDADATSEEYFLKLGILVLECKLGRKILEEDLYIIELRQRLNEIGDVGILTDFADCLVKWQELIGSATFFAPEELSLFKGLIAEQNIGWGDY